MTQTAGPGLFSERWVARVTIQFKTPFVVRRGEGDLIADSSFVADAHGLPALPGSAIAGVLRHAMEALAARFPDLVTGERVRSLFGWVPERRTEKQAETGVGSRLTVSWAAIHGADDVPVEGIEPTPGDPVLAAAHSGILRDHVRIGHRGAAEDAAKFEERLVGAGHRFTFELALTGGGEEDDRAWDALLGILCWPGLRLGAGTRRGLGRFRVVRLLERRFHLRADPDLGADTEDIRDYRRLPVALSKDASEILRPREATAAPSPRPLATVTLRGLRAVGPWVFGGGDGPAGEDIAPVTAPVVTWGADPATGRERGAVEAAARHYVPASAFKGALAKRLSWHYNRLSGVFADDLEPDGFERHCGPGNDAVRALLGTVDFRYGGTERHGDAGEARAGLLLLDDLFVPAEPTSQSDWHVAIDRFTGGVRAGALFRERVLHPAGLGCAVLTLVDPMRLFEDKTVEHPGRVVRALEATLEDLRRGRIAFGAGAGRGNGVLLCDEIDWDEEGRTLLDAAEERGRAA